MDVADRGVSAPGFWEDLYARGEDGWDLGGPAPPLAAWLAAGGRFSGGQDRPARLAVPGCGRGHDARLLAAAGYAVTGFDFAEAAIAAARARAAADDDPDGDVEARLAEQGQRDRRPWRLGVERQRHGAGRAARVGRRHQAAMGAGG